MQQRAAFSAPDATGLNLGCGRDIRTDCVNVDAISLPGVDIVHDLRKLPLPFPDGRFEKIYCLSVIEHIPDYISLIRDLHRLLEDGGLLHLRVPHFSAAIAYEDPQHVRYFTSATFDFFTKAHPKNYYFDFAFERVDRKRITFTKSIYYPWNFLLETVANISELTQRYYEKSPLRIFPAEEVEAVLVK